MTRISQDQIDLSSETALDLLVKSNEDKATLAATLTNKGTAANPDTETWSALLTKTADLNVESGRALLDVPIVSRTLSVLSGGANSTHIGVAYGKWAYAWKNSTTLRCFNLKNETAVPAYNTSYDVLTHCSEYTVNGVVRSDWRYRQSYINANNQLVMINTTKLSIYDINESTGVPTLNIAITLATSVDGAGSLCGGKSDNSAFVFYNSDATGFGAHAQFRYISAADGSVNAFNSVPSGSSAHAAPCLYDDNDLLFGSSTDAIDTTSVSVKHFSIDWNTKDIVDTGNSFLANASLTFSNNVKILTSSTTSKRYIPFFYNSTFLYGLDDGVSAKICEGVGNAIPVYNNACSPTITDLSTGGHVVISNYGLPIFLNADLSQTYTGCASCNAFIKYFTYTTSNVCRSEQQIYDEETETVISFNDGAGAGYNSFFTAKFHVHLNKVAGYTRLYSGVTTPFWAQTTDADIAAGALDKAEVV